MSSSSSSLKWATILGVTAAFVLLDSFFAMYVTSYGLNLNAQDVPFAGMKLTQLQWLPVLGVALLSFVAWYEAYYRIFPRRGFETDPLGRIRLLRAITLSIALFIWVMFVPYLIGSNWFWARLSETGKSVPQIHGFGLSLLGSIESTMRLNQVWQYSLSQTLAAAVMIFAVWVFGRSARRQRPR